MLISSRMNLRALFGSLLLCSLVAAAHAEPRVIRMGLVAPEGTEWARIMRAVGREVERDTQGQVQMRFYMGGIAGDELTTADRIRRGQLDGSVSGGMLCQELS